MKVKNIKNKWVSVVEDVDCANLSSDEKNEIISLFAERKIVIIKNQHLTNLELKNFCSLFGTVWDKTRETFSGLSQSDPNYHEDNFVEIVSETGILKKIKVPWHIDLTHFPSQLIPNRVLYSVELGETPASTQFIDTVQGLNQIDPELKKFLSKSTALCKAPYETPWKCYVRRPAANWHPIHNDYGLVADELFTQQIEELSKDIDYKTWIRQEVIDKMISDETYYVHTWEVYDLLLYDNWSTIHFRDSFNGTRKLKRVTWDQNWYTYNKEK
jgi:alpha-ketoglutarate-dependent taurine dioxygenase